MKFSIFSTSCSDPPPLSSTSAQPKPKSQSTTATSGSGKSKTAAGGASGAGGVATGGEARKVPKWFKMGKWLITFLIVILKL